MLEKGIKISYSIAVREGLQRACLHMKQSELSDSIGLSRQTLSNFLHGRALGPQKLAACEKWLKKNSYWPYEINEAKDIAQMNITSTSNDTCRLVATNLRNAADFLESNMAPRLKRNKLVAVIDEFNESRDLYLAGIEKTEKAK